MYVNLSIIKCIWYCVIDQLPSYVAFEDEPPSTKIVSKSKRAIGSPLECLLLWLRVIWPFFSIFIDWDSKGCHHKVFTTLFSMNTPCKIYLMLWQRSINSITIITFIPVECTNVILETLDNGLLCSGGGWEDFAIDLFNKLEWVKVDATVYKCKY